MKKRLLSLLLSALMILSLMPAVFAAEYNDVDGHWAEDAIDRWSDYGIVQGYDGGFNPDGSLTRGQLAAVIARLLNLPEAEDAGFADADGHWAEDVINSCAAAGIMKGDGVNARPDDTITREETIVMLARALGIKPVEDVDLSEFTDHEKVADWAEGYVAAMTDAGLIKGIDGGIAPDTDINRASAVTLLNRAITTYANEPGATVEATGSGIVLVVAEDVTVTGEADSVLIAQGAAGGTTNLDGVTAGSITVQAADSVVIIGEGTEIGDLDVSIQASDVTVKVDEAAKVENVTTEATGTTVEGDGKVENVQVGENAADTTVNTEGSKVENNSADNVTVGTGTVESGSAGTSNGEDKAPTPEVPVTPDTPVNPDTPTTPDTPTHVHVTTAYMSLENGTHIGQCSCGATYGFVFGCEYGSDEVCDLCGYVSHVHNYTYTSLENGKHNKVCSCGTVELDCEYGDDEICDFCNYDSHVHNYSYVSLENGKHNKVCTCETVELDCEYGSDEVCDLCNYDSHVHNYSYVSLENGTHNKICTCETTVENCDGDSCTKCGYITGAVAKIGTAYFATLKDAVAAATNGSTITILANIDLGATTLYIPAGKIVTFDLNGKVISGVCNADQASMIYIENTAKLTVKDTSANESGKITYASGTSKTGFEIDVKGDFVLESGTIELTGGWNLGFAVDVRPNAWGTAYTAPTTFTMNGGKIDSSDTGVRVDSNSSNSYEPLGVTFTMNAGVIESEWDAIFVQHRYANNLYVNVVNGTVSGTNSVLRIYGSPVVSDVYFTIENGSFTGVIKDLDKVGDGYTAIKGGTFAVDPSAYVALGYTAVEDNGTWTVIPGAKDAAAAQAILDNAATGTTLYLAPGVDYGTLVFRQNSSSTVVDITTAGGDAAGNEKYRRIENLTIIGAEDAIIDGFDFQTGWIAGSGASFIDIKNFTIKDVTFSGEKTAFIFEGSKGSGLGIDGLTIENCKMNDANGNDRFVFQQITGYKELVDKTSGNYVMTTGIKNLTITGCEITGAYMVIESRAMENLTITNNTFKNIKQRDMLITSDTTNHANVTYTGAITITGNNSNGGEERFVRASLNNSDAVVIIKDNTITNYKGKDADYIKVEGGNNVTIENNTLN